MRPTGFQRESSSQLHVNRAIFEAQPKVARGVRVTNGTFGGHIGVTHKIANSVELCHPSSFAEIDGSLHELKLNETNCI